jgi:hypothetical protein
VTYGNTHSGDDYDNYKCDEGLLDENEEEEGEVVCYEEEDESGHDEEPGSACPEKSDVEMDADLEAEDFASAPGINPQDTGMTANLIADPEENIDASGAAAEGIPEGGISGACGPVPDTGPEKAAEEKDEDGKTDEENNPAILDPLDPNLRPDSRYFTVRTMRKGCTEPKSLNRRLKNNIQDPGFNIPGDKRWYRNNNITCMDRKLNISLSFLAKGFCHTCLSGDHDAWVGRKKQP